MRECEFLSIDKYEKNIENYSTQLKYECSVLWFFYFFIPVLFFFYLGWGFGPFYHYHSRMLLLSYLCGGGSRREYITSTLCLLLRFSFF